MTQLNLKGIIPPLVTPLLENGKHDEFGTAKLVDYILRGGVHALFLLGTTGEGPSLSPVIQRKFIKTVMNHVNGKVPVLVAISNSCYSESLSLAEYCSNQGVSAVVSTAPFYFPLDNAEVENYFTKLANDLSLPLVIYNMPGMTKIHYDVKTIVSLAKHDNIIGLKDSSGDMGYFHQLLCALQGEDFMLVEGPEHLLAESVLLGGDGAVCGGANIMPELFVKLYEASQAGDVTQIRQLHRKVLELGEAIFSSGGYGSSVIRGLKCALSIMGLCEENVAPPFQKLDKREKQQIHRFLQNNGVLNS